MALLASVIACVAGETSATRWTGAAWAKANADIITKNTEAIVFMASLTVTEECGRRSEPGDHGGSLLYWANTARLTTATRLTRSGVGAVAAAIGRHDIGERVVETFGLGLHPVSQRRSVLRRIYQDAGNGARRDVEDIVNRSTPIGITGQVAGQEAKPFLAADWSRGNAGI